MEYIFTARPGASHGPSLESAVWWDLLQCKSVWHIIISVPSLPASDRALLSLLLFVMVIDWALREATQDRIFGIQFDDMTHLWPRFCRWCLPARRWLQCSPGASLVCHSGSCKNGLNHQCQKDASNVLKLRARKPEMWRWCAWKCKSSQLFGEHHHRQQRYHQRNQKPNCQSHHQLEKTVQLWKANISTNLKAKLHQTCMRSTLLYRSESWNLKKSDMKAIDLLENKSARRFVSRSYMQLNSYIRAFALAYQ